eukprot:COSAG02_NODE_23098_length_730_cov_1.096672_1_plen_27_part_10
MLYHNRTKLSNGVFSWHLQALTDSNDD